MCRHLSGCLAQMSTAHGGKASHKVCKLLCCHQIDTEAADSIDQLHRVTKVCHRCRTSFNVSVEEHSTDGTGSDRQEMQACFKEIQALTCAGSRLR